ERLSQPLRHVDVEAGEFFARLVEIGEGAVVAGHADAQGPALDDLVEPGGLLGRCRADQQKPCQQTNRDTNHAFSSLTSLSAGRCSRIRPTNWAMRGGSRIEYLDAPGLGGHVRALPGKSVWPARSRR